MCGSCLILMSHKDFPAQQSVQTPHWLTHFFGNVQEGSPSSHQHPLPVSRMVILHTDARPPPPHLPLDGYRLEPTSCQCVCSLQQQLRLQSLETTLDMATKVEVATRAQSDSVVWHRVWRTRIIFPLQGDLLGPSSAQRLA